MIRTVTVNARDPHALGTFWAQVLDGSLQDDDLPGDPAATVTSAGTPLLFERAEGHKTHLCLQPERPRDEEVVRLQGLGAQVSADRRRPDGSGWVVMTDPEGNEFCVLRSGAERGEHPVSTPDRPLPDVHLADERTQLVAMLEWYREGVLQKVQGVGQADAVRRLGRSATTVAGLVKHLALVEDSWFTERTAGLPMPAPWDAVDWDADPDWEFRTAREEPLADSVALYEQAVARSRAVLEGKRLDDTLHTGRREVSVRFVVLHLVEETARHLGHLDVLRELLDGTTGE